jgi:hypothetical protein
VPWSLGNSQVDGQVIGTIGSRGTKKGISIERLLVVAIPSPACIGVGIPAGTLTVVNPLASAVTNLDSIMAGSGVVTGTIHGERKLFCVAEDAHLGRSIDHTTGQVEKVEFGERLIHGDHPALFYFTE